MSKGEAFRGKGPKINGYAHTNTSPKSRKFQRAARARARKLA